VFLRTCGQWNPAPDGRIDSEPRVQASGLRLLQTTPRVATIRSSLCITNVKERALAAPSRGLLQDEDGGGGPRPGVHLPNAPTGPEDTGDLICKYGQRRERILTKRQRGPDAWSAGGLTNTAGALLCLTNKWSRSPVTAAAPPQRARSSSTAATAASASLGGRGRNRDGVLSASVATPPQWRHGELTQVKQLYIYN